MDDQLNISELTADIVSAYVGNNPLPQADLPSLIANVYDALAGAKTPDDPFAKGNQRPAVSIKRSVTPDYIICLEDGKKFRTIKRHLRTEHEMSPEQYRQKWGLAPDYPIVASEYTDRRSAMAKKAGLGQRKRKK